MIFAQVGFGFLLVLPLLSTAATFEGTAELRSAWEAQMAAPSFGCENHLNRNSQPARTPPDAYEEVRAQWHQESTAFEEIDLPTGGRVLALVPARPGLDEASPFEPVVELAAKFGLRVGYAQRQFRSADAYHNPLDDFISLSLEEIQQGFPRATTWHEIAHGIFVHRQRHKKIITVIDITVFSMHLLERSRSGELSSPFVKMEELGAELYAVHALETYFLALTSLPAGARQLMQALLLRDLSDAGPYLQQHIDLLRPELKAVAGHDTVLSDESFYERYSTVFGSFAGPMAALYKDFHWLYLKSEGTRVVFPVADAELADPEKFGRAYLNSANNFIRDTENFAHRLSEAVRLATKELTTKSAAPLILPLLHEAGALIDYYDQKPAVPQ